MRSMLALLALSWPLAASAQLVVTGKDSLPSVPNPADQVAYPGGVTTCNNTIADAGARAVLRAIDSCPVEFYKSRIAYARYAQEAILLIAVPGATEAVGAQAADKLLENALFCISGALVDESGASDADKVFMKTLVAQLKEFKDRAELDANLGKLRAALQEKGKAGYLANGELRAFIKTLDVTLEERYEGLEMESKLVAAGRARYDTVQARADQATEQARALIRDCRFAEGEAALDNAQKLNLAYLAELRTQVEAAKHARYCLDVEENRQRARQESPSPFLQSSKNKADNDVAEAMRLDEDMTRFIGRLADLQDSAHRRRNDIDKLRGDADRLLQVAREAAGNCEFDRAANALDTLNQRTLECALELDAQRKAKDEAQINLAALKQNIGDLEREYAGAIAMPFEQVASCGEYSIFADSINQFPGGCRAIAGADAKVAALRERGRACAEFKTAARTAPSAPGGALKGNAAISPEKYEPGYAGSFTRATYSANSSTWEREFPAEQKQVKVVWTYTGVPASLTPGQKVTIEVSGGVVSEKPKGVGDGLILSGVVAVSGDISDSNGQQADRGHPKGEYTFVVNPNARHVEIHLGGAPAGTGTVWKYSRDPAG